jgi:hypothetical protein
MQPRLDPWWLGIPTVQPRLDPWWLGIPTAQPRLDPSWLELLTGQARLDPQKPGMLGVHCPDLEKVALLVPPYRPAQADRVEA